MFNKDNLLLNKNYTIDVKIDYNLNYWVSGILTISQNEIKLVLYGETNENSKYEYNENFEQLTCTNYLNTVLVLINVNLTKSHHANLDQNRGSFYSEYIVEEIVFNKNHKTDISNFDKISFKSKDLKRWIGHTQLQNDITDAYFSKSINQVDTTEFSIAIGNMYLSIFYPISSYWSPSEYKAGLEFNPVVNIAFQEEVSFTYIRAIYQELLHLLYLLYGYDLNIEEVTLYTSDDTFSYYYKQKLDRTNDRSHFIPLGHNLKFNDNNILETPLDIFKNFFQLDKYNKSFFYAFRKYKMFHYSEEQFLGYFRILENLMFKSDELFTEEFLNIYIENVNLSPDEKNKEKELLTGKLNPKSVINTPLKQRKEKIKFIIYHYNILKILPQNYKLLIEFKDVESIVKLRNDITHFDNYTILQNDLEKYIDYLEFVTTYTLMKLIGFSDEHFTNVTRFYANTHRVYNFE